MSPPKIAIHSIQSQAGKPVADLVEERVAAFADNPRLLDAIAFGLSKQTPERMRLTIDKLIAGELPLRAVRTEIMAINLRAASIYAERIKSEPRPPIFPAEWLD